ncbi:hypothetical protein VTN31DRAFT_3255 [Thermomyces dupontii]|uniref:uncharacterized protein n=1 Tax=Talaromyces thermophilus TaxID=28565 RepID=UPI003744841D
MSTPKIVLLGTCDTKLEETLFLREQIVKPGTANVLLLDVGRTPVQHDLIDVSSTELVAAEREEQGTAISLTSLSRADYIKHMIRCATSYVAKLFQEGQIHGIAAAGGSCGTSLATAVMRDALPVGFPKVMVSTMASGDVKPYIEETDIMLMYSVVDVAGANSILKQILTNAAGAILGAATAYYRAQSVREEPNDSQAGGERRQVTRVGVTMFGVTTPCVDAIRSYLESQPGFEVYVFHATGSGGKAMERLIREKQLDAVLDITTTEVADELVGGVLSAGPDRLAAAAQMGIPQVISVGACDMVNFGPRHSVPSHFAGPEHGRLLYEHNPVVTLMRTTPDECARIAEFIASQLRKYAVRPDLIHVLLPLGGISMISTPSKPFYDPAADAALFDGLENRLAGSGIEVTRDDREINDPGFAILAAKFLLDLLKRSEKA